MRVRNVLVRNLFFGNYPNYSTYLISVSYIDWKNLVTGDLLIKHTLIFVEDLQ